MKIKTKSYVDSPANFHYLPLTQTSVSAMVLPGGCTCSSLGSCSSCSCAIIAINQ